MNIEVERCGDVRMTQEHAHGFIVATLRLLKGVICEEKGLWLTTKKTVFGNQKACVYFLL